ncbi:MAG: PHP domain-containing protein [Clostridia bacterium]|nr:PHP domain-containing protein [Clostridia bacterium]
MSRYFCDLHIHSCLSPCADDDMTPGNIAGMATINGLQIVALTDHNTSKNCPAFFKQAQAFGLIPVPGMELTTTEDIHVVCLFATLEDAMAFDAFVDEGRPHIKNETEFFGHQYLINEDDSIRGEEDYLLLHTSGISIEEAYAEVYRRGGACFPAHVDRPSGGMIEVLGDVPPEPPFTAYELRDGALRDDYTARYPTLAPLMHVVSSDAHRLTDIAEAVFSIEIADEPYSSKAVRAELIRMLREVPHG